LVDHTIKSNVSYSNRAKIAYRLLRSGRSEHPHIRDIFRERDFFNNISGSKFLRQAPKKRSELMSDTAVKQNYINSFFGKKKVRDMSNMINIMKNPDFKVDAYDNLVYNYKLRKLFSLFFGKSGYENSRLLIDIDNNQRFNSKKKVSSIIFSLKKDFGSVPKRSRFKSFPKSLEDYFSLGRSNVMMSEYDSGEYKDDVGLIRKYLYKKYFGDPVVLKGMDFDNDKYLRDYILDDNKFFVKYNVARNYVYNVRLRDYYPYGVRTLREFLIFIFCIPSVLLFSFIVQ